LQEETALYKNINKRIQYASWLTFANESDKVSTNGTVIALEEVRITLDFRAGFGLYRKIGKILK